MHAGLYLLCAGFLRQVLEAFAGFTSLKCGLLGAQQPRQLLVAGDVISPVPCARAGSLLTQRSFQAAQSQAAPCDGDVGDFVGPGRE